MSRRYATNESSSGSGRDDGGSLAGNVSATVLSIILSFFSIRLLSAILRSSGSLVSSAECPFIELPRASITDDTDAFRETKRARFLYKPEFALAPHGRGHPHLISLNG